MNKFERLLDKVADNPEQREALVKFAALTEEQRAMMLVMLKKQDQIAAIKFYRQAANVSLRDAFHTVNVLKEMS